MNDLFKKLNTLVRAQVSDALTPRPRTTHDPLGKKLDDDVESLRERINQAIEHEDKLQAQVATLHADIARLDQQADEAVEQGNDALARHLIAQMQRSQQHLAMVESDLREHQIVAQELIQRVNLLEATVADKRYEEQQAGDDAEASVDTARDRVSHVVREVRDKIAEMSDRIAARQEVNPSLTDTPQEEEQVDSDLEARRNRLSKR